MCLRKKVSGTVKSRRMESTQTSILLVVIQSIGFKVYFRNLIGLSTVRQFFSDLSFFIHLNKLRKQLFNH